MLIVAFYTAMSVYALSKALIRAYHIKKGNIQLTKGILIDTTKYSKTEFSAKYNEYLKNIMISKDDSVKKVA